MFEDDMHGVLKTFNNPEDFDVDMDYFESTYTSNTGTQGLGTDHPSTQLSDLTPLDCIPHLWLITESRVKMMQVIGAEGEATGVATDSMDGLWERLESYLKVVPVVRLISSEYLRKERSQVRILKAKSRLIKYASRELA